MLFTKNKRVYVSLNCSELEEDPLLMKDNVHLASVVENCRPSDGGTALFFYAQPNSFQDSTNIISSRHVVIGPFDEELSQLSNEEEESVLDQILGDKKLAEIYSLVCSNQKPQISVMLLVYKDKNLK